MSEAEDVDDVEDAEDAELDDDSDGEDDDEEGMTPYLIALRGGAVVLAEDPAELEEVLRFWGEARIKGELLMLATGGWIAEEVVGIAVSLVPEDEDPELGELVETYVGGYNPDEGFRTIPGHPNPSLPPTTVSQASPPKRGRFDG